MTKEERIQLYNETRARYDFGYGVLEADELDRLGFFTAPASTKYHGAYEGGLFDHSFQVFQRLERLTKDNELVWERKQSPFIIGMFHDLCKCDQYKKVKDGVVGKFGDTEITSPQGFHYEYDDKTLLKGHGVKSIMVLAQLISLTEEEVLCIRYHMGPYEKEEWPELDAAIKKNQNVYWTHAADMLASKVDGI